MGQMKIRSAYKFIIFKITADKKFIEIETKGEKDSSFEDFTKCLLDGECRYGVLDVEIDTKSVKPKMLYASSKDALKKALTGINEEYQATERGDLDEKEIAKKAGSC